MAFGDIIKKKIDNPKFKELTGAETYGDFMLMTLGKKPLGGQAAENIKKEKIKSKQNTKNIEQKSITKAKRSGRRYTILTSSKGLTNDLKTSKKSLLGG